MQKLVANTWKIMIKIKNHHILIKFAWNDFKLIEEKFKFNANFPKSYNNETSEGYFLEVIVQYSEKFYDFLNNLPFLPERMKIEKVEKLVANLHDKEEYVIHTRNLKQVLKFGLVLKKVRRVITFNQKSWVRLYININTDLRKS